MRSPNLRALGSAAEACSVYNGACSAKPAVGDGEGIEGIEGPGSRPSSVTVSSLISMDATEIASGV